MTWTTLDQLNDTSVEGVLSYPSLDFPIFWPLIQLVIFIVLAMISYFAEKDRVGRGNFLSSLAVSSFVSLILAVLMRVRLHLIDKLTFNIELVICFIFIALYMLTKD